jgi:hypothetical protein
MARAGHDDARPDDPASRPREPQMTDPNQVGKRYTCAECGTQVICVKRGDGRFSCHGQPMDLQSAKPLPSSD